MRNLAAVPSDVSSLIDRFFETPMKVDRKGGLHDITRSSLRRSEALALASLVFDLRPEKSIEIGLAEGGSCVAITASRRHLQLFAPHVVLDPFQESLTQGAGLIELNRLGLQDAIMWHPERSESFLHNQWERGEANFDFAFVDGGHDVGQKVTDAFYLNKVLRPGGVVAFHDALLFSTASAVYYLVKECGYSVIALPADDRTFRILRSIRYLFRLGRWYSLHVIPALCRSLVALRKPVTVSQD
jgi:predicted O-methyltransferase YrrM